MTVKEAIAKWSEACTLSAGRVRDGNWQPITHALRHFVADGAAKVELAEPLNGDAVLLVTPAKVEPPEGKSPANRPPFLLLVR